MMKLILKTKFVVCIALASAAIGATSYAQSIIFPNDVPASTRHIEFRNVRELGAKGDGVHDDTEAFLKAFAARKAPPHEWTVVYVPKGTYLVTDTIGWPRRGYLLGEDREKTVIRLKDKCPGFDGGEGKPVISTGIPGPYYGSDSRANAAFANYVMNLTIDTGRGNPAAIGARYTTHNQGILGEVTIRSQDGLGKVGIDLSDTEFGPGFIRNVTIEGFEIGIDTPGNVSHATLAGITLKNQREVGIRNRFPMSLQDLTSHNRVPAIRNEGGMAHLVLIGAQLTGGSNRHFAVEHRQGATYLRNVKTEGYRAALGQDNMPLTGANVNNEVVGETHQLFPKADKVSVAPLPTPHAPFVEPPSRWRVVDGSAADDTRAIQQAIDSGARTLYFRFGETYHISDTIHVRGNVRRIIGFQSNIDGRKAKDQFVGTGKPLLKFDGKAKHPVSVWGLHVSAWPWNNDIIAIEIDSPQDIHFSMTGWVAFHTTPRASGTIIIDEGIADSIFEGSGVVVIRQCNVENNPFNAEKKLPRTYLRNKGSHLVVLGMKTESPAVHTVTTDGGLTEILGGFFRDHFGPDQYNWHGDPPLEGLDMSAGVPCWITRDASIFASYYQYAWASGKARRLQAIEIRDGKVRKLEVSPNNYLMGLYLGWHKSATDHKSTTKQSRNDRSNRNDGKDRSPRDVPEGVPIEAFYP
jgi:hypothetical protein